MDLVFVTVDTDSHSFFDISGSDTLSKAHHKLGDLLHVNHIFGFVSVSVDDFGTASNLKRLLLLKGNVSEKKENRKEFLSSSPE